MPFPKAITRFNRRVTNPILGRLAGRLAPFAIVVHRGRRTGREYRTPVMAFPRREGVVFALTYGLDVDWVRNVPANPDRRCGSSLGWAARRRSLGSCDRLATCR